jgi:hypothetical protein
MTKQFGIPDTVVKSVMEGSAPPSVYSPYMKIIHQKHVIGVNISFMIGNWIDIVFFGDNGFFMRYQEGLSKYPGLRVTCSSIHSTKTVNWVKVLLKDNEHVKGISKNPKMISWNGNSGAAAINLAAHTGAKRIILVGFDMNLNENKNQHWHDIYQRGKIDTPEKWRKMQPTFERHLKGFEQIAIDAKQMGIEILNASPTSEISQFPKYTVKELLFDNT